MCGEVETAGVWGVVGVRAKRAHHLRNHPSRNELVREIRNALLFKSPLSSRNRFRVLFQSGFEQLCCLGAVIATEVWGGQIKVAARQFGAQICSLA